MCGLFGWIGDSVDLLQTKVKKVGEKLFHRGPDDEGFLKGENFALGFRRLSILDMSSNGHQPMSLPQQKCHIAYNGEIYNYMELRNSNGLNIPRYKGHSDTEVLLHLLSNQSERALPLLNGMFAFAFVDEKRQEFLLARDRLGVKPLFYAFHNHSLVFASELPALLEFGLNKKINEIALNRYVRFGHIFPPDTIFEGIYKLEPGHFLKGSLKDPANYAKQSWWELPMKEEPEKPEKYWLDAIDDLLLDATRIRLVSDVPVGLFLSGGLDSSLIAHYTAKQSDFQKPKAVSVTFEEKDFDESGIAAAVARHCGLELITIRVNKGNLDRMDKIHANIGEPFTDSSLINQYYLSEEARRHAIVFLTGDGGDEAFAGYTEYLQTNRYQKHLGWISKLVKTGYNPLNWLLKDDSYLKQRLSKLSVGPELLGTTIRMNYLEPILTRVLNKRYQLENGEITDQIYQFWHATKGIPLIKRMQLFDYRYYLEPDVLVKVDRATMAHSVEARSPFMDYRVVELALTIPGKWNLRENQGKYLLRKLSQKYLPPVVHVAPKMGFGLPYRRWINRELMDHVRNLNRKNGHDLWNKSTFNYVIENASTNHYDMDSIFWRVWMFEEWFDQYMIK